MAFDEERRRSPLPLSRGGLDAGEDVSRILALSDGVFAFALTLLAINLVIPTNLGSPPPGSNTNTLLGNYLLTSGTTFIAYGLAFFIIGSWWIVHHRIFRWIERYDRRLMAINLLFLLFIAVTPFDVGLLARYTETTVAVGFYAGAQALAGLVLVVLLLYLRGPGRRLMARGTTDAILRRGIHLSLVTPTGFGLSIPLAFFSPVAAIVSWVAIFLARGIIMRTFPDPADVAGQDRELP